MKISIIGAGAFGTAIAVSAERAGHDVSIWAHDPRVAEGMTQRKTNEVYLPKIPLGDRIHATHSLEETMSFSDIVIMVVPSHYYRDVLKQMLPSIKRPIKVVSATKGIENETLDRMSQVTGAELGEALAAFAVLSGPTFALELARGDPTAAVIASSDVEFAEEMQRVLSSPSLRLYHSPDVAGVELAGSIKNVIAIAAGVLEGLGLGSNTNAALITRGLHEVMRLGMALGGRQETFAGLAGMGDLVLTCTGALSRNRSVGVELGRGKSLEKIVSETRSVAEGVKTSKAAKQLAEKHGVEMPITAEVYRVIYESEAPRAAIQKLMTRSLKPEVTR